MYHGSNGLTPIVLAETAIKIAGGIVNRGFHFKEFSRTLEGEGEDEITEAFTEANDSLQP